MLSAKVLEHVRSIEEEDVLVVAGRGAGKALEQLQELAELLGGKDKVMGFFVGQLMRELKGKANPDSVRKALAEEIERRR